MAAGSPGRGERIFERLARTIARRPWVPIVCWALALLAAVPLLGQLGASTQNNATTLSNSSPSSVASAEMARLFPNGSNGSLSLLVLVGPQITGPAGQNATIRVAETLAADGRLGYVADIQSYYSAYAGYLAGQVELAGGVIAAAEAQSPPLSVAINSTSALLWGPPAAYLATWQAYVAANPSTTPSAFNEPAYSATQTALGTAAGPQAVLTAFYQGNGDGGGFNGSADCAADPARALACSQAVTRAELPGLLPTLLGPNGTALGGRVLAELGIANYSSPANQSVVESDVLGAESGLPAPWLQRVNAAFPGGRVDAPGATAWATALVQATPVTGWPLPTPPAITRGFVDPTNDATILLVHFSVSDGFTAPDGTNPVFADIGEIARAVPAALSAAGSTLAFYQTGPAPLDKNQSDVLDSSLAIVLPLTVVVLIAVTMLYFRSPLAPALTFGGLGIALGLSAGAVVLVGRFLSKVDPTALTLENTFVLGVGTDYAIFLLARYREELIRGQAHPQAFVRAMTWAGQSIATSGGAAVLATLALAFSGVTLLSQWGTVLSVAVAITVLVSLTFVPAVLYLVGPRIFWPYTKERFRRVAAREVDLHREERTYFYRAGRRSQQRPWWVVGLVLAVSIPLVFVALTTPISYDFYDQVPPDQPATHGLSVLSDHFGPGFAFPIQLLVSFRGPLLPASGPNATEFGELANLSSTIAATPDVAHLSSPVGPDGANLSAWLGYASSPPGVQAVLNGTLAGYLGSDGRTVLLTVVPASSGLSRPSIDLLLSLETQLSGFRAGHPDVTALYYGGGASVTHDLESQTTLATERMGLLVSLGLVVVLLAVLRSWLVPLLAVATIGLSIGWAWGITDLVLDRLAGWPLFFFAPTVLFILILGLGIDYNIFLLTRVREERLRVPGSPDATVHAVARTGGVISAAAVILASAFAILLTASFLLIAVIGFAVATAVILDATVVRTYLVPAALQLLGPRAWGREPRARRPDERPPDQPR